MADHKTNLSKFKKTEVIPNIFSDHNGMKIEINDTRKERKSINILKNDTILNNHWSKRNQNEIKKM